MKNPVLLLMFFIASNFVYSQPNQGGTPLTYSQDYFNLFLKGDTSQKNIATFITPVIDNKAERKKADVYPTLAVGGINLPADIDVLSTASMQYLADSSKLYLMKIVSSTASGISINFNNFNLPVGARLFFYNASKTMHAGCFTNKNNRTDFKFNTQGITGNTIFIEYYEPKIITTVPKLHIYSIGHEFSRAK